MESLKRALTLTSQHGPSYSDYCQVTRTHHPDYLTAKTVYRVSLYAGKVAAGAVQVGTGCTKVGAGLGTLNPVLVIQGSVSVVHGTLSVYQGCDRLTQEDTTWLTRDPTLRDEQKTLFRDQVITLFLAYHLDKDALHELTCHTCDQLRFPTSCAHPLTNEPLQELYSVLSAHLKTDKIPPKAKNELSNTSATMLPIFGSLHLHLLPLLLSAEHSNG